MFNRIKKSFFGARPVKSATESSFDRVELEYSDGKEPQTELVHRTEWRAGECDKPMESPADSQKWFVERTKPLRKAIAELLRDHNPRYGELPKIFTWVEEGLREGYREAVSRAFNLKSFETEATVDLLLKTTEDKDKDEAGKLSLAQREVVKVLRNHGVKVHEIMDDTFFGGLKKELLATLDTAVQIKLGGHDETRRCLEIEEWLQHKKTEDKMVQSGDSA